MKTYISVKWIAIAAVTLVVLLFAVLPQLSEVPSIFNISTTAPVADACCGGPGGPGGGDPPPPDPEPELDPPKCSIKVGRTSLTRGESVYVCWAAGGSTNTYINPFGSVSNGGCRYHKPTSDITYKMIAQNAAGENRCSSAKVTVNDPPPPDPKCTLDASKNTITKGQSSKLTWTSSHADSASLSGFGGVSKNGSKSVSPSQTTTYTFTVKNESGTKKCTEKITVNVPPPPEPDKPTCTLNANPNSIQKGDSSTLTWTTNNANSASINQGIGGVSLDGNTSVSPTSDTTYTLTAVGDGGQVTCSDTVTVTQVPPPEPKKAKIVAEKIVCDDEADLPNWGASGPDEITGQTAADWVAGHESCELTSNWKFQWGPQDVFDPGDDFIGEAGGDWTTFGPTGGKGKASIELSASDIGDNSNLWMREVLKDGYIPFSYGANDNTNVDNVSAEFYCHTDIKNYDNYDRIDGIAVGNTYHCVGWNVPEGDGPDAPVCTLDAEPNSIDEGGSSTLTWTTENADTISIDKGIGDVDANASTTVSPTVDTTYTLTATGEGGEVTCSDTVTVNGGGGSDLSCDSFTSSESKVNRGSTFTLMWETTGATDVSINQGIGDVAVDGSRNQSINSDTTYTLTATDGEDTVTCDTTVRINTGGGGGGGSSNPRCDLDADKTEIRSGEDVELTWDNRRADEMTLEDSRGNQLIDTEEDTEYDEDDGSITVNPTRDTTYTLTIFEDGDEEDVCEVDITIEDDDVTVTSTRSQEPLVRGISLTSVPYTGFEAGPMLTTLFYLLLAAWSIGIAYVLVIRKEPVLGFSLSNNFTEPHTEEVPTSVATAPNTAPETTQMQAPQGAVPFNLPTGNVPEAVVGYAAASQRPDEVVQDDDEMTEEKEVLTALEDHAHGLGCLLSSDALRFIIEQAQTQNERMALIDSLVKQAKTTYPSEDGWMVINKERIMALRDEAQDEAPSMPQAAITDTTFSREGVGASSLAEALVVGNLSAAYHMLGERPLFAIAEAAQDLDALYRQRRGEHVVISDMLARAAQENDDAQLLRAIEALTSAVDATYSDETAAAKLAVMKAARALDA